MAQAHLEQFRIPREQVNVEEAARQAVWYQILHAKATQMLSRDPAQRDLLLAQQNSRLTKDALDSSAFLQADNNPDTYLATADEWLREHEELRTMEECVPRQLGCSACTYPDVAQGNAVLWYCIHSSHIPLAIQDRPCFRSS